MIKQKLDTNVNDQEIKGQVLPETKYLKIL